MADTFHCDVVTPARVVLEAETRFVAIPAWDGEIGVLKGRAPLLVRLGIGELRVETEAGVERMFVDGGFAEMSENNLTILTGRARKPDELDPEAARAALAEAQGMEAVDDAAFKSRQDALQRARTQIKMAP